MFLGILNSTPIWLHSAHLAPVTLRAPSRKVSPISCPSLRRHLYGRSSLAPSYDAAAMTTICPPVSGNHPTPSSSSVSSRLPIFALSYANFLYRAFVFWVFPMIVMFATSLLTASPISQKLPTLSRNQATLLFLSRSGSMLHQLEKSSSLVVTLPRSGLCDLRVLLLVPSAASGDPMNQVIREGVEIICENGAVAAGPAEAAQADTPSLRRGAALSTRPPLLVSPAPSAQQQQIDLGPDTFSAPSCAKAQRFASGLSSPTPPPLPPPRYRYVPHAPPCRPSFGHAISTSTGMAVQHHRVEGDANLYGPIAVSVPGFARRCQHSPRAAGGQCSTSTPDHTVPPRTLVAAGIPLLPHP